MRGDKIKVITKKCTKCKITSSVQNFHKRTANRDGLHNYCKQCIKEKDREYRKRTKERQRDYGRAKYKRNPLKSRNKHLKNTYGITLDDYNEMFKEQKGCCDICGLHQTNFPKRLVVDHCHDTGVVRGLLCRKCNLGIGHLQDSLENMKNAVKYLEKFNV